jgi:hypothetical protein
VLGMHVAVGGASTGCWQVGALGLAGRGPGGGGLGRLATGACAGPHSIRAGRVYCTQEHASWWTLGSVPYRWQCDLLLKGLLLLVLLH